MRWSFKAVCLSAVAVTCLPALARAEDPGITPTSIKIGMFAPLSGPNVAYGQDPLNAAKMWYEKINREGGVNGRKIEMAVEDDRCNASDVVTAVKKLVDQDQVFMLNGGSCSAATVAAADFVQRSKVPFVMLNAAGDGALFPVQRYVFGAVGISQHAAGGSMVKFAVEHLHAKKIGYIIHDDAYGAWNLVAAKFEADKLGATLSVESLNPAISDVTATMLKLRAGNPDVILLMTYARPTALIVRKAFELGMTMPRVLSVNGTADLEQLAENVGGSRAFTNFYTQDVYLGLPGSPSMQWVYDLFKASYPELSGQPGRPQVYMPTGVASAMVVVNALKAAGPNPTRESVTEALAHVNFDSHVMVGPISFTESNHAGQAAAIYAAFDGKTRTPVPGVFFSDWEPND